TEKEVETAFATAVQQGAGAVYVAGDLGLSSWREQIAALALRHKLPTTSSQREAVRAGQLISYGATRNVSPGRGLCRPHPQGRAAGRLSGGAADKVRSHNKSEDGKGAGIGGPADAPRPRRRSDGVM